MASIKPLGKLTDFETGLIKAAVPELLKNIEKACVIFEILISIYSLFDRVFPSLSRPSFRGVRASSTGARQRTEVIVVSYCVHVECRICTCLCCISRHMGTRT